MITIINVELRLKSGFVSQRFRLVSFRNGFVWFRFAKYSKPFFKGSEFSRTGKNEESLEK